MNNAIVLRDKERDAIGVFYGRNIERVKEQIESLNMELSDSYERFAEFTGAPHPDMILKSKQNIMLIDFKEYSIDLPLWEKAKIALQRINRLSTTRMIAEFICNADDNGQLIDMTKLVGALGATLKPKVDNNVEFDRIVRETGGEYYWGLKHWFEEKGVPKMQYRF